MSTLTQLLEILFNRRKVEDLDYNQTALIFMIAASGATTYWFGKVKTLYGIDFPHMEPSILTSALNSLILVGVLYKLLELTKRRERFKQCALAFIGILAITSAVFILTTPYPTLILVGMAWIIWSIVICVRIFKQTFEVSGGRAFFYYIGVSLVSDLTAASIMSIFTSLTPESPNQ